MDRYELSVEVRDSVGKSAARSFRRQGQLPGIVYREGASQPILLNKKEVSQFINSTSGEQVIVNLKFGNGELKAALLKDYQADPIRGDLLHTDFFEVSMKEAIVVTVPVVTVGESVGVKRDGGILQHILREIEIESLPDKIPGHIDIDITGLELGGAIHISDIQLAEGVSILNDPNDVVVNVIESKKVEVEEGAEEAEVTEPEVEKKGKKEEEEPAEEK